MAAPATATALAWRGTRSHAVAAETSNVRTAKWAPDTAVRWARPETRMASTWYAGIRDVSPVTMPCTSPAVSTGSACAACPTHRRASAHGPVPGARSTTSASQAITPPSSSRSTSARTSMASSRASASASTTTVTVPPVETHVAAASPTVVQAVNRT
ncbi:hypothetical protein GCM10025876_04310 [Demequina litorisediminis]|uniref:Uncharacterized protein n=1 Tax=Demequina litorisediminis TaxID=1849022 RepID=A0ABQ6I8S1_9MICO|nr:hypothetical protein GCM10025876_04310 [Demequina litorisediminis]